RTRSRWRSGARPGGRRTGASRRRARAGRPAWAPRAARRTAAPAGRRASVAAREPWGRPAPPPARVRAPARRRRSGIARATPGPSSRAVLPLVEGPELAGLERLPPRGVVTVPAHRRLQRGGEGIARRPAELPELGAVQRVASIVTGAIGHGLDEALGLAGQSQDLAGEGQVLDLVPAAHVVDLAVTALAQDQVDGRAVVEHVEPVAHLAAVAVERQRLVLQRVGDEERNHLLRVLVGTEVVRRARDDHRHAVRVP